MKNYNLQIGYAAFIAASVATQVVRPQLYKFKPLQQADPTDYKLNEQYEHIPSAAPSGENTISLAEEKWNGSDDYWLGRNVLTDLVLRVPDKGVLTIPDVTINVSKQKEIVKTAIVGRAGTIKEYITDGDYQIEMSIGVVAVDENNEIIDQYPEKAMSTLREVFEEDQTIEASSTFLDMFGINKIVITGFSAKQMTYANRQVVEVSALSDDDYIIQSTDY
ncbi:DUF6046 domain-containing protein [uncultured Methanobrevibacter sp.]|uniref:DUF6046 domain-containing protein n=1 Tax=uncultured Methanobrevibacter sp. TaxID=253161 RepID=UPI0026320240